MAKGLKIQKGYPETVNRRTNNMMAKRDKDKGQAMTYKTLHRKLKIEQDEPTISFHFIKLFKV
jgi:hypothetical protein